MRLFSATIATETNTFSPLPTSLDAYKESVFLRPGEHPTDAPRMCTAPLFVARQRAAADGFTLIEGSCFAASPAGTTNRADYEFMRDEILAQLKAALPLDGVLFGLHGAMVAHGYDDVEGDVLERARAIVGPDCVIGVELDPHCHLTVKRVQLADINDPLQGVSAHRRGGARRGPADTGAAHDPQADHADDVAVTIAARSAAIRRRCR